MTTATTKIESNALFLNSEERYEVYNVKAAERPHLLHLTLPSSHPPPSSHEDGEEEELPLIDGCDIPGWRYEQLSTIRTTSHIE
eukprot:10139497-Ditylum_brightwellii.AAC.1